MENLNKGRPDKLDRTIEDYAQTEIYAKDELEHFRTRLTSQLVDLLQSGNPKDQARAVDSILKVIEAREGKNWDEVLRTYQQSVTLKPGSIEGENTKCPCCEQDTVRTVLFNVSPLRKCLNCGFSSG